MMMKRKGLAALLVLSLLAGVLPLGAVSALADAPSRQVIYVGNENVTRGGYWTTDGDGNVTAYTGGGTPTDNYIHYDADNNTLTLHNATIKESVSYDTSTYVLGAAIGVFNQNGDAELTITLEGTNTIAEVSMGIYVLASSESTGSSSLTITGDGSLDASGSQNGIQVQSNSGDATLTIQNVEVTATSKKHGSGVLVRSGENSKASLTVDGGQLTATGSGSSGAGIIFQFGSSEDGSGTPTVTVSNNAIVRASGNAGGISDNSSADIQFGTGSEETSGIVFNNGIGTVYGAVTLQENLTIGEGESLTIGDGASLTTGGKLTVNGGTLNGTPNGDVTYKVTGVSLNKDSLTLDVGASDTLTATITPNNATNKNVTWSSDNQNVATVENGKVTAVGVGTATITVTAADGSGKSATCSVTVNAQPTYQIAVAPEELNFSSIYDDQAAPAAQMVTITNTGNQSVTLTQPTAENYEIGTLSATTLAPNETATFTVQPKAGLSAGKYNETIAVSGENGATASVAVSFSVRERPYTPPVNPPTSPTVSEKTIDAINDAEPGETVSVALEDGDTTLDKEVFETLAGQDITLEISLENGVIWTVNGTDIPADADLSDLDLGVALNTDGIPANVVNAITGEIGTVQLTLAHDGDFDFTLTLAAPLGVENAGYWANLYHYNETTQQLDFEAAALIDEDGNAALPMNHASQYAIVIDDVSHEEQPTTPVSDLFSDVPANAWYIDAVQYAYDNGLMTGTSATTFEPNTSTTRAMIVAILHRLENGPMADDAGFTDVTDGAWYADSVNWAASVGVVAGFEDNTFRPNDAITREQMAALLYNYAAYKGYDVSASADLSGYSDQPSAWAEEVMQWAVGEGLISGTSATTLDPQGNATRAQVSAILQRFLEG